MQPHSPEPLPLDNLDWKHFRRLVGPSNAALARYDGILQTMVNPRVLLSPLMKQEAVLSSRIEGTQTTLEEILEFEASEEAAPDRIADLHEVINYRTAMHAAVASLEKRPICLNLIRETHAELMAGVRGRDKAPGQFRREQNYIAKPGGSLEEAVYIPPEPLSLLRHLDNFEKYVHYDEDDRLVQLALVHAQFELIHPFLDGNGRVGRILLPLFLYEKKLLSSPMFYLSAYLEAHRDEYYDRLGAISSTKDWEGWVAFFLRAVIEQAKANLEQARSILGLYDAMKQQLVELTHSRYTVHTLDALFDRPVFNIPDFVRRSGVPAESARRIIRTLVEEGILAVLREARGRRPAVLMFPELVRIANA